MTNNELEDVVVVGGGPAGLSAALWLGRYRRRAVVLDTGEGRNRSALATYGYLGTDGWDPSEIHAAARADVARYDTVRFVAAAADDVAKTRDGFEVTSSEGTFEARRVLLANGVKDVTPAIPGFDELYGKHIFHCSCCDGFESSGQDVLAIGWGEHTAGYALDLLEWGARVTLVTNGEDFEGDRSCEAVLAHHQVEVVEERVKEFSVEGGKMKAAIVESGRVIPAARAFFSIKHEPRNHLAKQIGCRIDDLGYVEVGAHGETTVEHVYAAGDLTPGEQLVQTAAAEGAVAGIACALSLRGAAAAAPDVPDPGPDPEEELNGA